MKKHIAIITTITMLFTLIPAFSFASSTLPAPKLYNHSAGKTSIKNYWTKVDGASGYQLYRATKKKGKYNKIKTTKKLSYIDKNLIHDPYNYATLYYKVRAYKQRGNKYSYGKFSGIKSAEPYWEYASIFTSSMSGVSKRTNRMYVTITNKGVKPMKMMSDGDYVLLSDSGDPFDFDDYVRGVMYKTSASNKKYPTSVIIKPGKTLTLTYILEKKINYNKNSTLRIYYNLNNLLYIGDINSGENYAWCQY